MFVQVLEVEKYDYEIGNEDKKYDVNMMRYRSNYLSGKASQEKTKRIGKINVGGKK